MVISGILEYGRTVEVLNNYKIGHGIELEPEIQNNYLRINLR